MIVSFRDKRTADFAAGKRVKAFSGIERPARLKLDRLEAAHRSGTCGLPLGKGTDTKCHRLPFIPANIWPRN